MVRTRVGYAGGTTSRPTYHDLADHTETVEVDYDPTQVSYRELLEVFWREHDARRPAWSRQYRSVIFVRGPEQRRFAEESRDREEARSGGRIHTAIEPAGPFTRAEDYHQKYRLRGEGDLFAEFQAMYPDPEDLADSTAAARLNGYLAGYGEPEAVNADLPRLGLSPEGLASLERRLRRRRR